MAQDTASQATRRPAEPAWMGSLRAAARARFDAMKWPALSEEEWRRTDVSRLALDSFQPALPAKPACPRDAEVGAQAALIRFEGTRCLEMGVSAEASAKGVRIMPLDLALEEFETTLHAAMDEAIARADNRFLAWHYASLSHGALLWVPGGVELADPIVIDMKELGGSGPTATMPHLQVVAGEGARAGIILRISGGGSGTLCNAAVDLRLAEGARVSFHEAQELDAGSLSFSHTHARVGKDATLTHC
ncbi:MAG TPA: SufD family Fe-S cluster assembly protein, partial [bacterium]|nr:SufD family Fe-S cluster assembly protein [bacterium]